MEKLAKIRQLVEKLNGSGIKYCHWKSNIALDKGLAGQTDFDLLIEKKEAVIFRSILSELCFRPVVHTTGDAFPSVEHYFALDEESGVLVHLHAYYRVITGESLAKNYRFPIEKMLLHHTREIYGVRVPVQSAELITFTLRILLKHTSLLELFLLRRYWKTVGGEAGWLLETGTVSEAIDLLKQGLPAVDPGLFSDSVRALQGNSSLLQRIFLGLRLKRQLRTYRRHSPVRAGWITARDFSKMAIRRLTGARKGMVPKSGGAVIAFVGPEATGKSTLIAEMENWLGKYFDVKQIHVGKPKSTPVTFLPNIFLPAFRALFPGSRTTQIAAEKAEPAAAPPKGYPFLFTLRSALLANDRQALIARAYRQAAAGKIILCDRYPSVKNGYPDSPQLAELVHNPNADPLRRKLARFEADRYKEIPTPDLIIYLSAPLEIAVERNATRSKKEPEDYVRRRHATSSNLEFGDAEVFRINTNQPLDQTILAFKKAIWNAL